MNCRITHIEPPCAYNVEGIRCIRLLDFDDFTALEFHGAGYETCIVTEIIHKGDFINVEATGGAKYNSTLQNGLHTHKIETFIGDLSAELQAELQLASKRRFLVEFEIYSGRRFLFGYEAGAEVSFNNQTAESVGSMLTISAMSIHPLFELGEVWAEWTDFVNVWEPTINSCNWGVFVNILALTQDTCEWSGFEHELTLTKDTCEWLGFEHELTLTKDTCEWTEFVNVWESSKDTCEWLGFEHELTLTKDTCEWGDFVNVWEPVKGECMWTNFENAWKELGKGDFKGREFSPDFNTDFDVIIPPENG